MTSHAVHTLASMPYAAMASPVVLAAFAASLSIAWLVYRLTLAPMSRLPGPWYTNLGPFFTVYHEFYGTRRMWVHNLHLRYGPVVRLGSNEASFASLTAMRDIYASGGGLVKTDVYSLFTQDGHRNLFTALDKNDHRDRKKRIADRYSNSSVLRRPVLDILQDRADAFAWECAKTPSADIYFYLHCYALDCVTAICFHPHGTMSIEGGKDGEMVRMLSYHDSRKSLVFDYHAPPWLARLYRKLTRPTTKGGRTIRDYAWNSMYQTDHAPVTLASRLLEFPEEELPMAEKVAECRDHIGAGIDTTGDTLCFLMYELSLPRNAARMARLTEELHAAEAIEKPVKLETLPYLNAVLSEALRLWAPGTMSLPRYAPDTGCTLDGFYVPRGTIVGCQSYTLHRYDASAFSEPDAFLPERWLDSTDAHGTLRQQYMFAFGAGPRLCIGKNLAMAEMRALLYGVYARYRTTVADDMTYSMAMADQFMTTRPEGMCCKLTFRPLVL